MAAAQSTPPGLESPRIERRRRAVKLVEGNDAFGPREKIKLLKLFTHDTDKVEMAVVLEDLPYMAQVMKDWADESN